MASSSYYVLRITLYVSPFVQDAANHLIRLEWTAVAGGQGLLVADDGFDLLEPGGGAGLAGGVGLAPLGQADVEEFTGRDIAAEQIDEAGGRVLACDEAAVAGVGFERRDETDAALPNVEGGQHHEGGEETVQSVFAGERGEAGVFLDDEMGFVEQDGMAGANKPGEERGVALPAKTLVADEIGIRGHDDGALAEGALDQDGVPVALVDGAPGGSEVFEIEPGMPGDGFGKGIGGRAPGRDRLGFLVLVRGQGVEAESEAPTFVEGDEFS